ncbi:MULTISPECIES: hypothetical protein [Clostridium]|jgi:hypothetical protein|uniref:hypothetical protein n=1 Tax=Clostridium TaxID=1485 RepID=UPI000E997B3A|nr:hypothetical protein [Clostridium tyrobutyricum]HBF78252.1 hypothetical protein [Clostridiaceae bacterium]
MQFIINYSDVYYVCLSETENKLSIWVFKYYYNFEINKIFLYKEYEDLNKNIISQKWQELEKIIKKAENSPTSYYKPGEYCKKINNITEEIKYLDLFFINLRPLAVTDENCNYMDKIEGSKEN